MPSSRDYVPVNDAELNDWVANFRSAIALAEWLMVHGQWSMGREGE